MSQRHVFSTYNWSSHDPRIRRRAGIAMGLIQVLLLIVLLYFGFVTPLPLPGEEGIAVSFGTERGGQNQVWEETPRVTQPKYTPPAPPQTEETPLTQDYEEAPEVRTPAKPKEPEKPKEKKPVEEKTKPTPPKPVETPPAPKPVETPPEPAKPVVNQQALFPGQTATPSQGGAGTGGEKGNQGTAEGQSTTPNVGVGNGTGSQGTGNGAGGSGGGIGYNVGNRKALKLPPPEYPSQKNGKVIVKVWVNKQGQVIKAEAGEKGSTLFDKAFLAVSEQAALQAHFDVASDAPETQIGTITYIFRLKQ